MSDIKERLVRVEDKLDFLCKSAIEDREERTKACAEHMAWTKSIDKKVDDHEMLKQRAIGAAKVLAVAAPTLGGLVVVRDKIRQWIGL